MMVKQKKLNLVEKLENVGLMKKELNGNKKMDMY